MRFLAYGMSFFVAFAIAECAWGQADSNPKPLTVEIKSTQVCKGFIGNIADISSDGRLVASLQTKFVCLFDITNGKQVGAFKVFGEDLTHSAIFSSDGKMLACTCGDGCTIHLLATASGKVLRRIGPFPKSTEIVAFSAEGNKLVTVCDNSVYVWDAKKVDEIKQYALPKFKGKVSNTTLSPDCKRLALQHQENTYVFEIESWKEVCRFTWGEDERPDVRGFVFSPDGRYLAALVRDDSVIRLWDLTTGKLVRDITWKKSQAAEQFDGAYAVTFSSDAKSLIAPCCDGRTRIWEVATGGLRYQVEGLAGGGPIAGSSRLVMANDLKFTLHVWDLLNPAGQQPAEIPAKQLDKLWTDLGEAESGQAFQALTALVAAPDDALALLGRRLKVVEKVDNAKVDQLITDLDDNKFPTREAASRQLEKLGPGVKTKLVATLENGPSEEVRSRVVTLLDRIANPEGPEWRLALRAVEVLEAIRTPAARRLLQDLAEGASGATLTEEAKAALKRLKKD
jgi:hypothetical protein